MLMTIAKNLRLECSSQWSRAMRRLNWWRSLCSDCRKSDRIGSFFKGVALMLTTILMSHDWNDLHSEAEPCKGWTDEEAYAATDLVVHGFLQAKIHGQDLVSLQASNSSLSQRPNRKLFQRSRTYLLNFSTNSSKVTSSWSPLLMSFKEYFLVLTSSSPSTIT